MKDKLMMAWAWTLTAYATCVALIATSPNVVFWLFVSLAILWMVK